MNTHNSCGLCRIDLKNLTVKSGKVILIENISLDFHCGELTTLIGKNGAGKTTLLKALLGERSYTGEIVYVRHDNAKITKPVTGYVPQHLDFDKNTPVTVLDFMSACKTKRPVWLGASKKNKDLAKNQLELVDCSQIIDKQLGELSGGELQRVLLAIAIDPLPDLLILDEPVSGIDATGLDLFYKMVDHLRNTYHMAIVLVSHDLNLIYKYSDKIVLLDKTVLTQGDASFVFESEEFKNSFGSITAI